MNRTFTTLLLATAIAAWPAPARTQSLDEARASLRTGDYDAAYDAFRSLIRDGAPAHVHQQYVRALLERGHYDDAIEAASEGPAEELHNVRGEALYAVGRIEEAEAAFEAAVAARGRDRNVALLNLGVLLWNRGERDRAYSIFDSFIDLYNGSERLPPEDLISVGLAVQYMGIQVSALFQDALLAFDNAADLDSLNPRIPILTGELFLQKYASTEAHPEFDKVLDVNPRNPRALLGKARAHHFDGNRASALQLVDLALVSNPRYPDALSFRARLSLATEDFDEAVRLANEALHVNPAHLDALAVLAASHFLRGETAEYERVRARALSINPTYPDLYNTVAEIAIDNRKYHEAVDLARQAVTVDSMSWRGWGILGQNQMRIGLIEEGRASLERAFNGDPYNPWFKNNLDLLDTFSRYETIETEHFELFIDGSEADLLGPYAADLAERAYDALLARYRVEPPTPIRIELFPSHADFSVRTLGLPGLGALGVTFGNVIVMDSPTAHPPGEFNWASVLWHELAHAFHLGMTDHNVPRWFSEGLSVHEQKVANERWGHQPSPAWLQAYNAGRLNPVSSMNEGFVRPAYPEQVPFSYYQASLVFAMIEGRWGFDSVLQMLHGYEAGRTTNELIPEVFGMDLEDFDEVFDDYVHDELGDQMAAVEPLMDQLVPGAANLEDLRRSARSRPGSFQARLRLGQALFDAGDFEAAEEELQAARQLFPEYGGADSPYAYLARIHRDRGELEQAVDYLVQLGNRNEALYQIHVEASEIFLELGRPADAADALARAVEVSPHQPSLHADFAALLTDLGRHDQAVLERQAVIALDPVDRAAAYYELARAQWLAGDAAGARSSVLDALEIAPTYQQALDLLLEIRGGGA